jgi:hypothetical protein
LAMLAFCGVTSIATKVAAVTLKVVEPDILPIEALMAVEPGPTAVASPLLLIMAAAEFAELQVTCDERFCFEPSVYTPVAVN